MLKVGGGRLLGFADCRMLKMKECSERVKLDSL